MNSRRCYLLLEFVSYFTYKGMKEKSEEAGRIPDSVLNHYIIKGENQKQGESPMESEAQKIISKKYKKTIDKKRNVCYNGIIRK